MQLSQLYTKLLDHFGKQGWWPAETRFEVIVGAMLTQRTNWRNAELAIKNLKDANMLSPSKIASADINALEQLIRPSGFYKQKAHRLKTISEYIINNNGTNKLKKRELSGLRKELLAIKGIGNETADSILLYAFGKPVFVIDAYTQRIFKRAGIVAEQTSYSKLQKFIEEKIKKNIRFYKDVNFYKEFHALIVLLGKIYCRSNPLCETCPVKCKFRKSRKKSLLFV